MIIRFKDGSTVYGELWEWRPLNGWFSVTNNITGNLEKILLKDIEYTSEIDRTHIRSGDSICKICGIENCDGTEQINRIQLAKKQGWNE